MGNSIETIQTSIEAIEPSIETIESSIEAIEVKCDASIEDSIVSMESIVSMRTQCLKHLN